jgi:hypothetical protein
MQPPTRRGRTKEIFWRKAIRRQVASGLSQSEFCKRENLNPNNLSWWKREIANRDANEEWSQVALPQNPVAAEKESYWRKMLARFEGSCLDKSEFCSREGIKPGAFSWWRGELERRDGKSGRSLAAEDKAPESLFVPLSVTKEAADGRNGEAPQPIAEIEILTGTMRIFDTTSGDALVKLLRALKESIDDRYYQYNANISLYSRHGHAQEF